MRADVAQREHPSIAGAADQDRLAQQRLVHDAAGPQVGADECDVPQSAQQLGLEILHGLVPGAKSARTCCYSGMSGKSVSPGLPPA